MAMEGAQKLNIFTTAPARSLWIALPIIVGLIGILLQAQTYLNHDVAWVLYSSRWLLEGKQFGYDIIAANPPFIWWLSAIPVYFADTLGIPSILTFRIFVVLLIVVSLASSDGILRAMGTAKVERLLFLTVGAYVFTLGAHRDFGQRESLTLLLALPYLLITASRVHGLALNALVAFAIGFSAGIGLAFKPYFIAIPVAVESALIVQQRTFRTVLRPEALGGLASAALSLAALTLFARPWLTDVLPEINSFYWAFNAAISAILVANAVTFCLLLASIFLIWRMRVPASSTILIIAAIAFAIAALLQSKGYSYHFHPVSACMLLALALSAPTLVRTRSAGLAVFCTALALHVITSTIELYIRSAYGKTGKEIEKVVAFIEKNVPVGEGFLAISTHPFPGFPTAIYADRHWLSPSNSRIFLPAVVRLRTQPFITEQTALEFAETKAREAMLRDISAGPEVILISVDEVRHAIGRIPFDFLDFYLEDPEFAKIWSAYERIPQAPEGYIAYRRKDKMH